MTMAKQLARVGIIGLPPRLLDERAEDRIARQIARNAALLAYDAAPTYSAPNNAVPEWLTAYISPETIRILTAPTKAEEIYGPEGLGSWGCGSAKFRQMEHTGDVEEYDDRSTEGTSGYNVTWPERTEHCFQTMSYYGDMENAVMSMVGVNAAMEVQEASASAIKRGHNKIWFYGIDGKKTYGILNDPNLPAPIAPLNVGGTIVWSGKSAQDIYNDFLVLFTRLVEQSAGLIEKTSPMKLVMSTTMSVNLDKINDYGISVTDMLKKSFPNLTIVTAAEYSTDAGQLLQLIATSVAGQTTGSLGYTALVKAHGVLRMHSSFEEKKSAGNLGAIIRKPLAVAQMLGV